MCSCDKLYTLSRQKVRRNSKDTRLHPLRPPGVLTFAMNLLIIPTTLVAYLLGSIPFGVLAARIFGWPDPRTHGSGHTGGLNTIRGGGVLAGLLVVALDIGKGFLAVWLTTRLDPEPPILAVALAGAAVVAGHNWPLFARFKGGMGLSTSAGAMATHAVIFPVIGAVAWGLFTLIIRHSARAVVAAAAAVLISLWLLRVDAETLWLGAAMLAVVVIRYLSDWNRTYD
jgi:glycerol-3-phosphate acyltransferase PlsY